ncbi:MAG TPA: hypothetical protein VGM02_15315 [Acidobacteriaceae bacterium]|jgi:hypothetical protein
MKTCAILSVMLFTCAFATAQEWQITPQTDPLTGQSYTLYVLPGKFLTPPSRGNGNPPSISVRCNPSAHHGRISGRFISGFIIVNTVIDLKNGENSAVQYRLDDGKFQDARPMIGNSTDYQAISLDNLFVNDMLWGHIIPHKPGTSGQVHKMVIGVQEHLDGQVVMQFDFPDSQQVAAACGTEYR